MEFQNRCFPTFRALLGVNRDAALLELESHPVQLHSTGASTLVLPTQLRRSKVDFQSRLLLFNCRIDVDDF